MAERKTVLVIALAALIAFSGVGCRKEPVRDIGEDIVASAFPTDFQFFSEVVDPGFSKGVMDALSALGDDSAMGFRTAGSPAEENAAGIIENAMREAGLANVSRESVRTAAWTFAGAKIVYTDFRGKPAQIRLGGYPAAALAEDEPFLLVDVGRGTAADYAGKDVAGKIALIDSSPGDWSVVYPASQAKANGAAAALIRTVSEHEGEDGSERAIYTQDIYGLTGFPVFAITGDDAEALRKEMRLGETGELSVRLSSESLAEGVENELSDEVDRLALEAGLAGQAGGGPVPLSPNPSSLGSLNGAVGTNPQVGAASQAAGGFGGSAMVSGNTPAPAVTGSAAAGTSAGADSLADSLDSDAETGESSMIWGEIPGRTDDVIYVTANYDGFYNSAFYGGAGAATVLGVAKALVDSGYEPVKTLRFLACGAGEWGVADSVFPKGAGLFSLLHENHPEWVSSAFAAIVVEGGHPTGEASHFAMNVSSSIYPFVERSAEELISTGLYSYTLNPSPAWAGGGAHSVVWDLLGVPVAAGAAMDSAPYYHSSLDSVAAQGFNEDAFKFGHLLYGKIAIDLDRELVRPVSFGEFFKALDESYVDAPTAWKEQLMLAAQKAKDIESRVETVNREYLESFETMQGSMEIMSVGLNRELASLSEKLGAALLRINSRGEPVFAHTPPREHIAALKNAMGMLAAGDGQGALGELEKLGSGKTAAFFDKTVCDYYNGLYELNNDGLWPGFTAGRLAHVRDAGDLARAVSAKLGKAAQTPSTGAVSGGGAGQAAQRTTEGVASQNGDMGAGAEDGGAGADFSAEQEMAALLLVAEEEVLRETAAAEIEALQDAASAMDGILTDYLAEE